MIMLQKAEKSDIETLIDIEKSVAGNKLYSPMLTHDEWLVVLEIGVVYLIYHGADIVGNVSYEKKGEDKVHISGLAINPQFQGRGFARQALMQVLEELKDFKRVDLVVHPENTKALSLYESLGFKEESRKENFYGDGEPRLILVLENEKK